MNYGGYPDVYLPIYLFFQNLSRDFENLWRIFDLLPIGVMAVNTEGIIIYYNRIHAKLDHLTQQEVLGRPEREVFGFPDFSPGIMRACQKMKRPILGFMCPYYTTKNPERIILGAYWVFPLFGEDKKIAGSICFTMPITDNDTPVEVKHLMWPDYMPVSKSPKKIIGDNKQLNKALALARNKADSPSAVLISGETGTGKELFARLIHDSSRRSDKPFMAINCSAIPGHLLEGLLFGTTKGSFTGALDRPGLFEEAAGGTVYLDEIDSMPMELQPKLLRVLQEMKVTRLGSAREIKLDVKLISSIGTPIQEVLVREKMRPDLFYRLAVIVINVPPLRERLDDLDELLNYFIAKYNKQLNKKVVSFDPQTKKWLRNYSWPGNVRELENLVVGSINMAENETTILTRDHLPDHYLYLAEQRYFSDQRRAQGQSIFFSGPLAAGHEGEEADDFLELYDTSPSPARSRKAAGLPAAEAEIDGSQSSFEQEELVILKEHLTRARGKAAQAAESLGISRQLLHYKMKKYRLSRYDFMPKLGQK